MTYKYIITQSLAMLMSLASNAFEVKSGQMVVVSADTAEGTEKGACFWKNK